MASVSSSHPQHMDRCVQSDSLGSGTEDDNFSAVVENGECPEVVNGHACSNRN